MGAFSTISHTPVGQAPAQKPQPIHLSLSTLYSKPPPAVSTREIAFCGQISSHIPQSRQAPQEAQWVAHDDVSANVPIRGSKY